jgi:hypothetical protein
MDAADGGRMRNSLMRHQSCQRGSGIICAILFLGGVVAACPLASPPAEAAACSATMVHDAEVAAAHGWTEARELTSDELAAAVRTFNAEPGEQFKNGDVDGATLRYGDNVPAVLVFSRGACAVEHWRVSPRAASEIFGVKG